MAAPVAKLVVNQASRGAERVPASRRRDRILEATVATIARFGLSRTTMERVAAAAKVSPGTVTFHFASKEALLLAALDHLAVEFDSARRGALAAVGDDPVRALLALIEVNFDPVISDRRKIAVWYAFWGEARARQEYMRRCGELDRQHSDQQVELFRRIITAGGHAHLDAEAVAFGLVGLMEGLWEDLLVEGRRFDRGRAKRLCRTYLTGLFPEELRRANAGGAEGGRT